MKRPWSPRKAKHEKDKKTTRRPSNALLKWLWTTRRCFLLRSTDRTDHKLGDGYPVSRLHRCVIRYIKQRLLTMENPKHGRNDKIKNKLNVSVIWLPLCFSQFCLTFSLPLRFLLTSFGCNFQSLLICSHLWHAEYWHCCRDKLYFRYLIISGETKKKKVWEVSEG